MSDLDTLIKEAAQALDLISNGQTYPSFYVADRFNQAADANSQDQLIGNMRDVIAKQAAQKSLFTQKDIAKVYDQMVGLAGGRTEGFRVALGDLLPSDHGVLPQERTGYADYRGNDEAKLEPLFAQDTELSRAVGSFFSLDNKPANGYHESLDKRAEDYTVMQLNTLGCPPQSVKAVRGNEHFILCLASYDMPNYSQVNVQIPVQISNGMPYLPGHLVQDGGLVELTKANLMVHIQDESNHQTKLAHHKFALERGDGSETLKTDKVVIPASLELFANLESELIVAASKFNVEQVNAAANVIAAGLSSLGVTGAQMKVASTDDQTIIFQASFPTSTGPTNIYVPIEIHNGSPILPSKFAADPSFAAVSIYDFDQKGMGKFAQTLKPNTSGLISRQSGEMGYMSYHELTDKVIEGVHTKDYQLSNDAIQVIQARFEPGQYQAALEKFGQMLVHTSGGGDREKMVEAAIQRGDLIRVPTSIEPYCPKLGMPASKVDFDEQGRPVPMRRKAQEENARESQGAYLSASRIYLS